MRNKSQQKRLTVYFVSLFYIIKSIINSPVAFAKCNAGFSTADLTFDFILTCGSPDRFGNHYAEDQLFLCQTITEHREQDMTHDAMAEWLNNEGHLTFRGKKFRGERAYSILKRRSEKEELINREYSPVWSNFSLVIVNNAI